jgi:hypothetical protein
MSQEQQIVVLQGGLDLVTPAMMMDPGRAIGALNVEPEARGYVRSEGYERYDGRLAPSAAVYDLLSLEAGTAAISSGTTVTGATSGATAKTLAAITLTGGSYGGGTATGTVPVYPLTGTFVDNEALQVSGVTRATLAAAPERMGARTVDAHRDAMLAARTLARGLIAAPPGAGPIRGVATYRGVVHAWRDAAGGVALRMWKATPTGWEQQTFGRTLTFTLGTVAFAEGQTVTGATSGATATIQRVVLRSGAWGTDASGFLTLSGQTGTFTANETITSTPGSAKASANSAAVVLPAGGKVRAVEENFYALEAQRSLYFTTGTGRAFEWDGTTLTPILTGLSDALDKPEHIAVHSGHLFLSFDGGSLQWSSTGTPLVFNTITGAGEIGFGQDITGLKSQTRDSLVVVARNRIGYLVGSSNLDFDLKSVSESSGAVEDSLDVIDEPVFMDDLGVRRLSASQTFGDWKLGTLTDLVEPLLAAKRKAGVALAGVLRVRAKNQARYYWADGTGIVIYIGRKDPETMPVSLGFTPVCFHSGEDPSGREILLAGGDDGMVYRLDSGNTADGAALMAYVRLAYTHQGGPGTVKRYHRARFEGQGGDDLNQIAVSADFDYGGDEIFATQAEALTFPGSGGYWNLSDWGAFNWSAPVVANDWVEIEGIGESVSLAALSESVHETPFVLSTLTIDWTPRRRRR